MDFDAMDFLTGLFRGDAVPSGIGRDLGPQMTDNASALEETAGANPERRTRRRRGPVSGMDSPT